MDDDAIRGAAAMLYRYLFVRACFREGKLPETSYGVPASDQSLEYEMRRGKWVFGEVVVDLEKSPVLANDGGDPDFFDAVMGDDKAIEMSEDELAKLRGYVLEEADFPFRPNPADC